MGGRMSSRQHIPARPAIMNREAFIRSKITHIPRSSVKPTYSKFDQYDYTSCYTACPFCGKKRAVMCSDARQNVAHLSTCPTLTQEWIVFDAQQQKTLSQWQLMYGEEKPPALPARRGMQTNFTLVVGEPGNTPYAKPVESRLSDVPPLDLDQATSTRE